MNFCEIAEVSGKIPVKYACSCGQLKPLTQVYFCRHCLKLRCGFCVAHEIDSIYCPNCLENMPSQEARLRRNKCSSCIDCPMCQQTLSTRAVPVASSGVTKADAKPVVTKVFYSMCLSCRWTTRDIGIPDLSNASANVPERENVYGNRIAGIQDYYKNLVLIDQHVKAQKKSTRKYVPLSDKLGITAAYARRKAGLAEPTFMNKPTVKLIEPATPQEDVNQLPSDIFTKPINLQQVTTVAQRLAQVDSQPHKVEDVYPLRQALCVKKSQRCRVCEHNVSKPEYNPNSIKFKIHLLAGYHVPNIKLVTVEPLRAGQTSKLMLKLINLTQYVTSVNLLALPTEEEELADIQMQINESLQLADKKDQMKSLSGRESLSLLSTLPKQTSLPENPRVVKCRVNCQVELPEAQIMLTKRDDAAEFDDSNESAQNFQDDPKLIFLRKLNTVVIKLNVTPSKSLKVDDEVMLGFTMMHDYMNTLTDHKEPQKIQHCVKVYIKAGKIVGNTSDK